MRNFIDIVSGNTPSKISNSLLLFEGKQYLDMFKWLDSFIAKYNMSEVVAGRILTGSKELCRDLKRIDRQMWAARLCRLYITNLLLSYDKATVARHYNGPEQVSPDEYFEGYHTAIAEAMAKYLADYARVSGNADTTDLMNANPNNLIRQQWLNHFAGIEYSKIQQYQFDPRKTLAEVWDDLHNLEEEYKERISGLITLEPGDEIIKKFSDGFVWVMLNRGYCRKEADAMGHCGNIGAADGDRILSLRRFNETLDGVDYYNACLTFILKKDGYLGEMKGRANEKPAERYHPYIIALLLMPIIQGIRGGGYAPANNFALSDLTDEQREALLDQKPQLGGFQHRLKKLGDNPKLREDVIATVKQFYPSKDAVWEGDEIICVKFKNVRDFVEEVSDDEATKNLAKDDPFEHWDFSTSHIDQGAVESFVDALPLQHQINLARYAAHLIEENGDEDEQEDFDLSSTRDVVNALKEYAEDVYDLAETSISDGERFGAEGEAINALVKAVKDAASSIQLGTIDLPMWERDGEKRLEWDSPFAIKLGLEEACKFADKFNGEEEDEYEYDSNNSLTYIFWDEEDPDEVLKVDEPYYGWNDYDESAAIERFLDEVDIGDYEQVEKPEGEMPDFKTMDEALIKKWISETYDKIPDGFVRKVHPEALDQSRLADVAAGLWRKYYGMK